MCAKCGLCSAQVFVRRSEKEKRAPKGSLSLIYAYVRIYKERHPFVCLSFVCMSLLIIDYVLDKERQLRLYGSRCRQFTASLPVLYDRALFAASRPSYLRHVAQGRKRCRPARDALNADVVHAASSLGCLPPVMVLLGLLEGFSFITSSDIPAAAPLYVTSPLALA